MLSYITVLQIIRLDDSTAALEVAKPVVEKFVLPTFSEEGKEVFLGSLVANFSAMFSDETVDVFGAQTEQALVGYISVRRKSHIHHLFVATTEQHKGIGRMLLNVVEERAKASNISQLTVRASLNAIAFYQKCGFETISDVQETKGIRFQPMQKPL